MSLIRERIVVVSVIILATTLATITSLSTFNEAQHFSDSFIEINDFQNLNASSYYYSGLNQLNYFLDNKGFNNNLELFTLKDKNDLSMSVSKSYNFWNLSHYWTFLRFSKNLHYNNWIQGFLFFNQNSITKNKFESNDNSIDIIIEKETNEVEANKHVIISGGSSSNNKKSSGTGSSILESEEEPEESTTENPNTKEEPTGRIYFVATNGKNSNDGSESFPWRTIQKAAETIRPGDTVFIKEGYYNERIWPEFSGNTGEYITYSSYKDDEVFIDGSNIPIEWGGLIHIYDKHHIKISGLNFRDSSSFGIYITGQDANNIIIENCDFKNHESSAIQVLGRYWLREIHGIDINNNTASNICINSKQEAISLSGINDFSIHNNYVSDCPKYAINVKDGCANGRIYNNRIETSKGNGIYCDAFDLDNYNIKISENAIWGKNTAITLGTEQGGTLRNIQVFDNIIFTTGNGFQINNHSSSEGTHKKTNIIVQDNIFYDNSICILITDMRENFDGFAIKNNIFNKYGNDMFFVHLRDSDVIIYNNFFNKKININFDLLKV
jgi:hypothetical protein